MSTEEAHVEKNSYGTNLEEGQTKILNTKVVVSERGNVEIAVVILTSVLMGLIFGTTFAKSHVFEPYLIRAQFIFMRFVMLKMFLSAMGTGAICLAIVSKVSPGKFERCRKAWESVTKTRGWLTGTITGTMILGAGMAIAGACPGMVLSQVGAGVSLSGVTVAGGLSGALMYGLLEDTIKTNWLKKGPQGPTAYVYVDQFLKKPYFGFAILLGVACIAFAIVLEVLLPWKAELPTRLQPFLASDHCNGFSITCCAWPPAVAGALLGLMQIPAVLVIGTFLGSATSYQVCSVAFAIPFKGKLPEKFSYINSFLTPSISTWWQLGYCGSAILGAFLWINEANDVGNTPGVDAASAFIGGFLMLFGARLAAGCTSGHGISGCAIGMIQSFIGVPFMFLGGILVAVIWHFGAGAELYIPANAI